MKSKKYLIIIGVVIFSLTLFWLINPDIPKKVKILDCEGTYQKSVFGRKYEGPIKHNAEMDVAKCLCEKYLKTKNPIYEKEIKNIIKKYETDEFVKFPIDSICKHREDYFFYWYDE